MNLSTLTIQIGNVFQQTRFIAWAQHPTLAKSGFRPTLLDCTRYCSLVTNHLCARRLCTLLDAKAKCSQRFHWKLSNSKACYCIWNPLLQDNRHGWPTCGHVSCFIRAISQERWRLLNREVLLRSKFLQLILQLFGMCQQFVARDLALLPQFLRLKAWFVM